MISYLKVFLFSLFLFSSYLIVENILIEYWINNGFETNLAIPMILDGMVMLVIQFLVFRFFCSKAENFIHKLLKLLFATITIVAAYMLYGLFVDAAWGLLIMTKLAEYYFLCLFVTAVFISAK